MNLDSLNREQREAVVTTHGPVLILAGAGTGKTRVITARIAHLVRQGVSPEHILAVTFTNKAAREMLERVQKLVPAPPRRAAAGSPPVPRPTISTFHSLCVRILRQHIDRLGYKTNFVIYDDTEQLGVVKRILSRISNKGEKVDAGAVLAMLSRFKNTEGKGRGWEDPGVVALAEHVRNHYESALRACNAVDFDDLILLVLRLFREYPDVLQACQERYRFVMVDEYQDTNAAQFQVVHALTKDHRNLCVVGDDDQSIYGWRGAEIANLLNLEQYFPEVKVIKLEQNYRSTGTILNAANAVIRHNVQRRAKRLWSQKGEGSKITLFTFPNDEDEARTMVEEIEYRRRAGRIPWADQAILFRTNGQARPLETALRKAGVRYHLVGGQSFFDRREVRDFLAYLKMLLNPHDDISLLRIANVPPRGLSDVTMQRLVTASQERHQPVYQTMRNPVVQATFQAKTQECLAHFLQLIEHHRGTLKQTDPQDPKALQKWAQAVLDETGYLIDLRRSEKDPETAESRVQNVKEMVYSLDVAGSLGLGGYDRLTRYLEEITLDNEQQDEKEKEAEGNAVTLITMHSCKGLEFPHVYIVGLEDGLLPHARSKDEGTLDEERRLFYVAITRAQVSLTLSHCTGRRRYGQLLPAHASPFLKELPAELVERAEEKDKEPVTQDEAKDHFAALKAMLGD